MEQGIIPLSRTNMGCEKRMIRVEPGSLAKEKRGDAMGKQSEQVMKKYFLPVLFVLLLIFPAGASAGSKTKAQVLSYLTSLSSQSSKKVLSGQRAGWLNDGANGHDMYGNDIFGDISAKSRGIYPAIMGADIDYYGGGNPYILTRLIDHWNNGGLVELTWHAADPANNNVWTWPINTPTVNLPDVYTPGNSTYNNFRSHMVLVGDALQKLQDQGVVVLFRPLHEMNSGNPLQLAGYPSVFWWGGKDYNQFKTLWKYVYNYFTNTRGLTNLIWVYAVCEWWGHELDYYPGSDYVDIVGYDYYAGDGRFPWLAEYGNLLSLGKPFALTELGQCYGGADLSSCINKDTRNIINDIKSNMPNVVYWMNWDDQWELGLQSNLSQLFADSWVVNRADNPSGTTGVPAKIKNVSPPAGISIQ
jgi:mannan endo-1,4-beta-mannosidase